MQNIGGKERKRLGMSWYKKTNICSSIDKDDDENPLTTALYKTIIRLQSKIYLNAITICVVILAVSLDNQDIFLSIASI